MSGSCSYSFADLFRVAFGREPRPGELLSLYALPQDEKNAVVREWAGRAGWFTQDIVGTDGQTYASFRPAPERMPHGDG